MDGMNITANIRKGKPTKIRINKIIVEYVDDMSGLVAKDLSAEEIVKHALKEVGRKIKLAADE